MKTKIKWGAQHAFNLRASCHLKKKNAASFICFVSLASERFVNRSIPVLLDARIKRVLIQPSRDSIVKNASRYTEGECKARKCRKDYRNQIKVTK